MGRRNSRRRLGARPGHLVSATPGETRRSARSPGLGADFVREMTAQPDSGGSRTGRERMAPSASRWARLGTVALMVLAATVLLSACGSSPAEIKPAQAKAAIERVYATLFDFANHSVTAKTAVVQDGSTLRAALKEALSSSLAKEAAGAKVLNVQLLSSSRCSQAALPSPCAEVTYNLLSPSHTPLFVTPSTGYAVYVRDHWLAAKSTICGLLELFWSASGRHGQPPGC